MKHKIPPERWAALLGEKIRQLRANAHLSQSELARLAGLTSATAIMQVEKGQNKAVNVKLLQVATELMSTSGKAIGWLFDFSTLIMVNGVPQRMLTLDELREAVSALSAGLHGDDELERANATGELSRFLRPGFELLDRDQIPKTDWKGKFVPLIGRLAAGEGVDTLEADSTLPGWAFQYVKIVNAPVTAFALRVEGDSMAPQFNDGDLVIVDGSCHVRTGICCVITQSNGDRIARLKKLQLRGKKAILSSLNPRHPTIEISAKNMQAFAIWRHLRPGRNKV